MCGIRVAVIMAGGSGERFWPLSRRNHPKQLLCLTRPDMSLLQEAVARLDGVVSPENIFVATGRHLQGAIIDEGGLGIPDENVIAEPCKRNTTGCLCYAAAVLANRYETVGAHRLHMAVLTADHQIGNARQFRACVGEALDAAGRSGALVTVGIRPTRPETGYGHIEFEENAGDVEGRAIPVKRFLEKPDSEQAERFFRSGDFLWNSGMFFWTLDAFKRELQLAQPAMAGAVEAMTSAIHEGNEADVDRIFADLESISIDYALMEKADRVLVIPASFSWDDIGAWDALERTYPADADGNITAGDPVLIDTTNSIVYNACKKGSVAVAAVGVDDLVVVVADDAVLVVPKERAQDVKAAVNALRERGAGQL